MKVLVVEDSEDSRNLLVKQLHAYGHEAAAVADGAEALEQALAQPPDIIVSDILMPKMDGYQLCRECKQNEQLKNIPFVFYTATYTLDEDKKFALSLGADAFILKPSEPDTLVQTLSEIFEKSKAGALAPPKVAPFEPSLFLSEHTKRIFTKLEDKVAQLEAEIAQRRRTEHALNERMKELQGLYGIASIAERPDITLDELYQEVANVLPSSWQYPEIACCRITIGDKEFRTNNYKETEWKQSADIKVYGAKTGRVEVNYLEKRPEIDEGPFLKEERLLVGAIAERLGQITEHKQAEKILRLQSEIIVNMAEGVYLVGINDGVIRYTNPKFEEMFGYSPGEMVGKHVSIVNAPTDLTPMERVDEIFEIIYKTGKWHGEVNNIKKDGTPFWSHANVSVFEHPEYGNVLVAVHTDITERKRAEEEIKHAAEEWRTTFDSITDLVSICDKDFKLVRVNKAFADVFKMKPQEVIGKPCYTLVHGTNEPPSNCPYKQTLKDGKPHMAEYFEPHLGMHLEESISPIFNEKGEVVACVHLIRDITERKQMEEQLIVTDRLASIGELASGIAHELNNPLTSVIGFSQLLLEKDVPDDVKEDVKIIYSEAQRTAAVVKNLLTFARKHDTEKQPANINSIIEKVLELRTYEQKVSNIQVNTRFAPDLPEIMADFFQLQQVFLNIVINAEHFMIEAHNRGTLTITTERAGDVIKVSFADDGPGIAKKNLGHLFDPFFTTKEVGKGTGLGLSICHGIITEHGGRTYAESELGKGATFIVELPITIDKKGTVK